MMQDLNLQPPTFQQQLPLLLISIGGSLKRERRVPPPRTSGVTLEVSCSTVLAVDLGIPQSSPRITSTWGAPTKRGYGWPTSWVFRFRPPILPQVESTISVEVGIVEVNHFFIAPPKELTDRGAHDQHQWGSREERREQISFPPSIQHNATLAGLRARMETQTPGRE